MIGQRAIGKRMSVHESSKHDKVEDLTLTTSLSADIKLGDLAKIVTLKELPPLTKQEKNGPLFLSTVWVYLSAL